MLKLMATSPVLDAKNIERVAIDYLKENLTTPTGVYAWNLDDRSQIPAEASTWLRIDYTAWPHEVKGKTVIVGALAVHKGSKGSQFCFNAVSLHDPGWRPVETFIVSDDAEQTAKNLKIAVARALEKYANLRKHNENHSLPYAPPRAPVQ